MHDRENREIIRLHRGEHFGERSLLSSVRDFSADCTCRATETSYVFTIKRAAFERHMGPLRDHLDRHDAWLKELEAAKGIEIGDLMLLPTLGRGNFRSGSAGGAPVHGQGFRVEEHVQVADRQVPAAVARA